MLPPRRMRACRRKIKPARKPAKKPAKRVIRPRKAKKVRKPRKVVKKRKITPRRRKRKPRKVVKKRKITPRRRKRKPAKKKPRKRVTKIRAKSMSKTSPHAGIPHRAHHHKTIHFDPRGLSAPAFNSMAHSKSTTYCKLSHRNMMDLGHTFGVSYKLEKAMEERGKRSLCEVLSDFFPVNCLKGWRITNFLGAGSFGFVFSIRNGQNKRGALKIVRDEANFSVDKEIEMQKKYYKLGMSPNVIDHCSYKPPRGGDRVHFILMERIDGVIDNFLMNKSHHKLLDTLVDRLFQIIKKMKDNNLTHGDFHSENIGFVFRRGDNPGKIMVIDHGMSTGNGYNTELELVQFMRTIESRYSPKMNADNRKFIKQKVTEMAKSMFNITLPRSLGGLENRFVTLRRKLYAQRK